MYEDSVIGQQGASSDQLFGQNISVPEKDPRLLIPELLIIMTVAVLQGSRMLQSDATTLNSYSFAVDKSKAKASSRQQTPQQPVTLPNQANGPPDMVPGSASSSQKRAQSIQQLKGLLAASNCRFEAVTVALQHWMAKVSA